MFDHVKGEELYKVVLVTVLLLRFQPFADALPAARTIKRQNLSKGQDGCVDHELDRLNPRLGGCEDN